MTYYDNHLEPDLVARFNATPDLLPVTGDDAYVMKPNYTDHEGRLNKHYIHSENHERLQIKYWCGIFAYPWLALRLTPIVRYSDSKRMMVGLAHFGCGTQGWMLSGYRFLIPW